MTIYKNVCYLLLIGKDSCNGDSGGPLITNEARGYPWFQVGIVSFGTAQCGKGVPGIYVAQFDKYLRQKLFMYYILCT